MINIKISYKTQLLSPLLKVAIKAGVLDAVRIQIERGANVNSTDSVGLTPLMLAAIFKQPEIFQFLLESGASLNKVDSKGLSAIDHAKMSGMEQIINIVFEFQNNKESNHTKLNSEEHQKFLNQSHVVDNYRNVDLYSINKVERCTNLIDNFNSQSVDFILEFNEDPNFDSETLSLSSDKWVSENETEVPRNDLDCIIEAEKIYKRLANHKILDKDENDWSDIKIDLPIIRAKVINVKDKFFNLYHLLMQGISNGMVNYNQILYALKEDLDIDHLDISLTTTLNIFSDLGILIEDSNFLKISPEVSEDNTLESIIIECLLNLHYELEGDLSSLNIYLSEIQKFDLIDRLEEESIGQQMNIALFSLAKNIANLPDNIWLNVSKIFENEDKLCTVRENETNEEEDIEEELESIDDQWNALESDETLNFWDIVVLIKQNLKFYDSARHIPRPIFMHLQKLLEVVEQSDNTNIKNLANPISKYKKAREKLINANFRLVSHYAKRYLQTGLPLEDLIQEGNIGLLKAIDKFDYHLGYKFSTYATWWIKQSITRAIANSTRLIRLPVHMHEIVNIVESARENLEKDGKLITISTLADQAKCSKNDVIKALNANHNVMFFDDILHEEQDSLIHYEVNSEYSDPEEIVLRINLRKVIYEQLANLEEREAKIIELRFGLINDKDLTLEEIGSMFNVTRERIRQIEAKALEKLGHISRAKYLESFVY